MKDETLSKIVKFVSLGILLCVLAWSFYIVGTPQLNRELRIDQHRIQDAYYTKQVVDHFYKNKATLPVSLDILLHEAAERTGDRKIGFSSRLLLRASEHEFFNIEYKVTGERSYSICTSFFHRWEERDSYRNRWENNRRTKWKHPAGDHCFDFEVSSL